MKNLRAEQVQIQEFLRQTRDPPRQNSQQFETNRALDPLEEKEENKI